jgi:lipid A ethanolaminephosphotransferase
VTRFAALARPRGKAAWLAVPLAILGVAAFIAVLDNGPLWRTVLAATAQDEHRAAIVAALFAIVLGTLTTLLALAPGKVGFKIVGAALLLTAAVAGYFMTEYGIVIDESMIRNIAETEVREAAPLLTTSFFAHLLLYGILPAALLLWLPLPKVPWRRALAARAAVIVLGVGAVVAIVYANYGALAFFARQNDAVRLWINPGYPIHAALQYYTGAGVKPQREPLAASIAPARAARTKPRLVIFVMGETARADRWSYNGYARDTNKYTRPLGVVNFPTVESCGTSTAESVPCIFSGLGRAGFSHPAAAAHESLFGAFQRLGIESFWRDNSTGCKEVCDPAHFEQFATRTDADFCDATGCFDEILLKGLDSLVADDSRDRFVVLHQRGSHGPAYHTDVPAALKEFLPECDLPNLRNCNRDEINNAYDNTILYTDYFLARVIGFLGEHESDYEVAMLYVSDHGESLGDNGLYLHGFPRALAPDEQIRVPMLFWASPELYASARIDRACVAATADRPLTHDSVFHTLLALLDVQSPDYRAALDLFAGCRGEPPAASSNAAR